MPNACLIMHAGQFGPTTLRVHARGRFWRYAILAICIISCAPALASEITVEALRAINRLTYGANDATADAYAAAGRAGFWAQQLHFVGDAALPQPARTAIQAMTISRMPIRALVGAYEDEARRIRELPEGEARKEQHKELNERYKFVVDEAQHRHIIRALYSTNQLQEQLTWFWFNHFNVFQGKDKVRLSRSKATQKMHSTNAMQVCWSKCMRAPRSHTTSTKACKRAAKSAVSCNRKWPSQRAVRSMPTASSTKRAGWRA